MNSYLLRSLTVVAAAFLLFLIISCGQFNKDQSSGKGGAQEYSDQFSQVIELSVKGMTCTGCEAAISGALKKLPGVASVDAYYMDGLVIVQYDTTLTSLEEIRQAIINAGYEPGDYIVVKKNEQ